jgi:Mor family transcriptional regulator
MSDLGSKIQNIAHDVAVEIMSKWAKEVSKQLAAEIEQRLRSEMAGDRGYISSASTASREAKHELVRRMFNGRNATQIARELKMGRATVYRILKRPG